MTHGRGNIDIYMRQVCPVCNSKSTIRIVYGMPSCMNIDDNVWLGGCSVTEYDMERHCNECGADFSRRVHADPAANMVHVEAKPGARAEDCAELADGTLVVRVAARAHDGEAKKAVQKVVAQHYNIAPSRLRLIRGATTRHKAYTLA